MEDIAQWILLFGVLGFGTTTMFGMWETEPKSLL